jgi:predicted RNase H-like HicB family nuclease
MRKIKEPMVGYVVNEKGKKTAIILPIEQYEELLEDLEDLAVVASRKTEPIYNRDIVKKKVQKSRRSSVSNIKEYSAVLKKSGKQFLALCLELGVVGSGSSPAAAKKALLDAIESYLEYVKTEGLPEERPVSVKELHEFLYYDDLFKKKKDKMSVHVLKYA